jgi:hypothetical protein
VSLCREGRIRRTVFANGALCDELDYGLTVEEFTAGSSGDG